MWKDVIAKVKSKQTPKKRMKSSNARNEKESQTYSSKPELQLKQRESVTDLKTGLLTSTQKPEQRKQWAQQKAGMRLPAND